MPPRKIKPKLVTRPWKGLQRTFRNDRFLLKMKQERPLQQARNDLKAALQPFQNAMISRVMGKLAVVDIPQATLPALGQGHIGDLIAGFTHGDLDWVEPDFAVKGTLPGPPEGLPDDDYVSGGGVPHQWSIEWVGMAEAWARQKGNDRVIIAIIDSGLTDHIDLYPAGKDLDSHRFLYGGSFLGLDDINDAEEPTGVFANAIPDDMRDEAGHGLAMTGVIAAETNNAEGIAGMNWGSPVGICRATDALNWGTVASIAAAVYQAIQYAANQQSLLVVNLSLGEEGTGALGAPPSQTLVEMCAKAESEGVILVCATGNEGDYAVQAPASLSLTNPDSVVAVSGTRLADDGTGGKTETYNINCNHGPEVTVVAPSDNLPVLVAPDQYGQDWGTSLATAQVSGLVSLMWSHCPELTPAELIGHLKTNTWLPPEGTPYRDRMGEGRIDAASAIRAVEHVPVFVLALDVSGSMNRGSGVPDTTRLQVMEHAVHIFLSILEPHAQVGVVLFSDHSHPGVSVVEIPPETTADPTAPQTVHDQLLAPFNGLSGSGMTSIGTGIEAAVNMLGQVNDDDVTGIPKRALMLITDGRENAAPWVDQSKTPAVDLGVIGVPVFSIGAGTPEFVDTNAMEELTAATSGNDITLGDWTEGSAHLMAKFLAQHLAGAVEDAMVLDPSGKLKPEDGEVTFEFPLSEYDRRVDVILMAPGKGVAKMKVFASDGDIYDDSTHPSHSDYRQQDGVTVFRSPLPTEINKARDSHADTWKVQIQVDDRGFRDLVEAARKSDEKAGTLEREGLPWTLLVSARSRLRMTALIEQDHHQPGCKVDITALIRFDGNPIHADDVENLELRLDAGEGTSEIGDIAPDGTHFRARVGFDAVGVHPCRIVIKGRYLDGDFQREQTLTATVWETDAQLDEGDEAADVA